MPEGNSKTDLIARINDAASQLGIGKKKFSLRNHNATTHENYSPQKITGSRVSQLTESSLKHMSPLRDNGDNELLPSARSKQRNSRNNSHRFNTIDPSRITA